MINSNTVSANESSAIDIAYARAELDMIKRFKRINDVAYTLHTLTSASRCRRLETDALKELLRDVNNVAAALKSIIAIKCAGDADAK